MFENFNLLSLIYRNEGKSIQFILNKEQEAAAVDIPYETMETFFCDNSQFCNDGTVRIIPPRLISEYAKQNFLYMLGFHYWHAGAAFYTRRSAFSGYLLCYTFSGEGHLEYNGKSYDLQEGDGFLIDGTRPHSYHASSIGWECVFVTLFGNNMCYRYQLFSSSGNVTFHQPTNGTLITEFNNLAQLFESKDEITHEYLVSHQLDTILLLLIQGKLIRQTDKHSSIKYITDYIQGHYKEDLTLDLLAKKACLSKYYLSKLFKSTMNMTLTEYITHVRIQAAMNFLTLTNLSANKIAHEIGMDNENYFYRLFKKETGYTPKEYKRRLLQMNPPADGIL